MDEKKTVRDISVSPVLALSLLVCALGTVAVTIGAAMVWGAGAAFVAFGALVFLWGGAHRIAGAGMPLWAAGDGLGRAKTVGPVS